MNGPSLPKGPWTRVQIALDSMVDPGLLILLER